MVLKIDEQMRQANSLTDRVRKGKEEYLGSKVHMCSERSRLVTESWKETKGQPLVIRRARLFKKVMEGIPIAIREGELIVGSQTQWVRGVNPAVDLCRPREIRQTLEGDLQVVSERVRGTVTEEDKQSILEDFNFWEDESAVKVAEDTFRELWGDRYALFNESKMITEFVNNPAARTGDFGRVLNEGLNSIISEARETISTLKIFDESEISKLYLAQAIIIACEALINYSKRHAELARQMAEREQDETRKAELLKIARTCEWVPANPARNFFEALQSFWFSFLALNLECPSIAEAPGRFDQYMYPFYKKDIEEGEITPQETAELLALMLLKCMAMDQWGSAGRKENIQGSQLINVTIAGVKEDGSDAANELTWLFLHVLSQVKSHQPHVSFRYHDGVDEQILLKAVEANRDHGGGIPAFFNDKAALVNLSQKGIPIREARNWVPQGCVERTIYPSSGLYTSGPFYNLPKILEVTLNNGVDPRTKKQIGLATGDPRQFTCFEELYDAYKKQVGYFTNAMIDMCNVWFVIRENNWALPYNSALLPGCLESGKDTLAAGARWNKKFLADLRPLGHANVANSLAAIKKLVYEEKKVTMDELLDALDSKWEGRDDLRQMCVAAPKWGNDDDYVDEIMRDIFAWTEKLITRRTNHWGERWVVSRQALAIHYRFGKVVGALPDGRKGEGEALADGSLSPVQGTDVKGPTAVINSAGKVDAIGSDATLLNMKFHPGPLQTRAGLNKFISLLKTHFDNYAHHIQCNMLSQETLLDAKAHPEKYRDLVVRVAGFSAFWVELSPQVQDEIIARMEHTL